MLSNTVVLKNLDPKNLHQRILQLEAMEREQLDDHDADTLRQTVKLLHMIEDELRRQVRAQHGH